MSKIYTTRFFLFVTLGVRFQKKRTRGKENEEESTIFGDFFFCSLDARRWEGVGNSSASVMNYDSFPPTFLAYGFGKEKYPTMNAVLTSSVDALLLSFYVWGGPSVYTYIIYNMYVWINLEASSALLWYIIVRMELLLLLVLTWTQWRYIFLIPVSPTS